MRSFLVLATAEMRLIYGFRLEQMLLKLTLRSPRPKALPFPATKSRTISPSRRATTNERYVRSMRKTPWLTKRPASLLDHRGIMMLRRLRNWCKKARLRPGLVCAEGTVPSPKPETRGGLRKRRRCASKVKGLVLLITTLDVPSLYGTYIVRDPSLLCNHELVRTSLRPCSRSCRLFLHHRRDPSAPRIIDVASARVARSRVVRVVRRSLVRNNVDHF